MIQEFLGGVIKPDQKHKISTISPAAAAPPENLRCPRCDSPNTKFCYYNNYNLTQPRHFCKTCRRYWTKGGALRNVPIGGGCRKNKYPSTVSTAAGTSPSGKLRTASSEFMKMGLFNGLEHAPDSAMAWTPSPTNYNFLSLLRDSRTPNYYITNNNSNIANSMPVKEKANDTFLFGASPFCRATGQDSPVSARLPSSGRFPASLYSIGESPNSGLHELSQRLRSPPPTSCYYTGTEAAPLILGNMTSANSSAAILESAPVGTSELGLWNASLSWPADLPTTNGVYP